MSVEAPAPEAMNRLGFSDAPYEPTLAERAWAAAVARLQLELSREVFTTWLRGVTLVSADEATFTLGVQYTYARDWLEKRLRHTIKQTLGGIVGHAVAVEFVLQSSGEQG